MTLFYFTGCVPKLPLNRCVGVSWEILNHEENETTDDSNVIYSIKIRDNFFLSAFYFCPGLPSVVAFYILFLFVTKCNNPTLQNS